MESTKYRQRIRLKDKRMNKGSVVGCGGGPEELPLNCAFRLSQAGISEADPEMEFCVKATYMGSRAV